MHRHAGTTDAADYLHRTQRVGELVAHRACTCSLGDTADHLVCAVAHDGHATDQPPPLDRTTGLLYPLDCANDRGRGGATGLAAIVDASVARTVGAIGKMRTDRHGA